MEFVNQILSNPYISTSLVVFSVLYSGLVAPKLPNNIAVLFTNPFFKMAMIFMIAYNTSKNESLSLILTISLVFTMQILNSNVKENMMDIMENEFLTEDENDVDEDDVANLVLSNEISKGIPAKERVVFRPHDTVPSGHSEDEYANIQSDSIVENQINTSKNAEPTIMPRSTRGLCAKDINIQNNSDTIILANDVEPLYFHISNL